MAEATEQEWDQGDQHWCTYCGWQMGLSTDEKVVYIWAEDSFMQNVDDFRVEDHTATKRTGRCGHYQILEDEDWDEPKIYDIVNGDAYYVCEEDGESFPTPELAESCC